MWMVFDYENGLVGIFEKHEDAEREYRVIKAQMEDDVLDNGEFDMTERLVLARVEKHLYARDTKEPVMEEDANGNEIKTKDTYWGWKEDIYSI